MTSSDLQLASSKAEKHIKDAAKNLEFEKTDALLKQGATPKGRKEIAEKSGISEHLILEWVNHVDLFRIKGVGEEYADLLEETGAGDG